MIPFSTTPRMDRMPAEVRDARDIDIIAHGIETPEQMAQWFATNRRDWFRYNCDRKTWMVCIDGIWEVDHHGVTWGAVRIALRRVAMINATMTLTRKLLQRGYARDVLLLCEVDERTLVRNTDFDKDPWLMGTPEGLIDLRTGKSRPAKADDMVSRRTGATPAAKADCPIWMEFLAQATEGQEGLSDYLQRFIGYCLTGLMDEEIVTFLYGKGGNGKGVFLRTIALAVGEYAGFSSPERWMIRGKDEHPDWMARLDGARMVNVSELPVGAWNLAQIKAWTGKEMPMTARFMYGNNFEFKPTGKLVFTGNGKPEITDVDEAIIRRMRLIEFRNQPENPDLTLKDRLETELPAILRWAIEGCLLYQKDGLVMPADVQESTTDYLRAEDVAFKIVDEWFEKGKADYRFLMSDTKGVIAAWLADAGADRRVTNHKMADAFRRAGATPGFHSASKSKAWTGIRLTENGWVLYRKWMEARGVARRDSDHQTGCAGWVPPETL